MYMYATCLACTIVITQMVVTIANAFGISKDVTGDPYEGLTWFKTIQAVLTSCLILGPLSLGREMGSLKNLSVVSVLCLTFTIIVVVIELPFYLTFYEKNYQPGCLQVNDVCYSAQFFNGGGVILFAFTNQCNVMPVYKELVNPVKRRLMTIIRRSTILVFVLYVFMSMSGYLSTKNNTPQVVLTRDPPTEEW